MAYQVEFVHAGAGIHLTGEGTVFGEVRVSVFRSRTDAIELLRSNHLWPA
jgi:hypothetical protein